MVIFYVTKMFSFACRTETSPFHAKAALRSILLIASVAACDGGISIGAEPSPDEPDPSTQALVRLVHVSPNAGEVAMQIAGSFGTPEVRGLSYGEVSSYRGFEPGDLILEIEAARLGTEETESVFVETTPTPVAVGQRYTVVLMGEIGAVEQSALRAVVLEEAFGENEAGRSRLRFVHAVPEGVRELFLQDDQGNDVFRLQRFEATAPEGLQTTGGVPADYPIHIDSQLDNEIALFTYSAPVGRNAFLIATGHPEIHPSRTDPGAGTLAYLIVGAEETEDAFGRWLLRDPTVYTLNLTEDIDALTVDALGAGEDNAAVTHFAVPYGQLQAADPDVLDLSTTINQSPERLTAGVQSLAAYASVEEDATPVAELDVELERGQRYAIVVSGDLASASIALVRDALALGDTVNARVGAFNASRLESLVLSPVADGALQEPLWFDGIAALDASKPVEGAAVAGQTYDLGIRITESPLELLHYCDVAWTAGERSMLFVATRPAVGELDGGPQDLFRLLMPSSEFTFSSGTQPVAQGPWSIARFASSDAACP